MISKDSCIYMDTKREAWSFGRLIVELEAIRAGLEGAIWINVRALCSIPGHSIDERLRSSSTKKVKDSPETAPMVRLYDLVDDIKEMTNQVDVALNNLGHELVPGWYESKVEKQKDAETKMLNPPPEDPTSRI